MEQGQQALREMNGALFILTVVSMVGASCASHTILQTSNAGVNQASATPASAKLPDQRSNGSNDAEKKQDVPVQFKNIDFKNFSYPRGEKKWTIRLKNGTGERAFSKSGGGVTFDFRAVDYADLTGDGKKEAIVRLSQVVCGGSCDGGSDLFYFFSARHAKPTVLSRIETGSIAYTCGLKSFTLSRRALVLEAFRQCRFDGVSLQRADDADERGGKFIAKEFTRFTLKFDKKKVCRNEERSASKSGDRREELSRDNQHRQ